MRANKHLLLWSSLGTLLVLGWAAYDENFLAEWRVLQGKVKDRQGPSQMSVELRQLVVPELHATDRCVSCHVGMAAGETGVPGDRVLGAHRNVVHDVASYGCTVCHGGQGRATTREAAHGEVEHWPEPMLPARCSSAGCGTCHTHLAVPNLSVLDRGRALVERHDCLACHRIDGRGGTLRPGGAGGQEGPDLSRMGAAGFAKDWYQRHLAQKATAGAGPWQAAFGEIGPLDRAALEVYLTSRVGAPGLVEGKALFHSLGCRGCHKVGGIGGDDGPDLTRVGQRDPALTPFAGVGPPHTLERWFKEHFRAPQQVVPGSLMPALGLTEPQIDSLTFYLFSLRRSRVPEAFWPKDRIRAERFGEREFASDGATLYGTFCAACHGAAGEGRRYPGMAPFPAVANPDFLAVASDDFLAATLQHGRPGRRMPAWGDKEGGLRQEDVGAVLARLREMSGGAACEPDERPARFLKPGSSGEAQYQRSCAGCHGKAGEGLEGPALANPALQRWATDGYLLRTVARGRRGTAMPGFEKGSTVRRALSPEEMESVIAYVRTWEGATAKGTPPAARPAERGEQR